MPLVRNDPRWRWARPLVERRVVRGRHLSHLLQRVGRLVQQRTCAPLAHHQVCFHRGALQRFEQPDPKDGSGCARDADDQLHLKFAPFYSTSMRKNLLRVGYRT